MSDGKRSKAEQRMIRLFEKYGTKRFRVLRSAETTFKHYRRPSPTQSQGDEE